MVLLLEHSHSSDMDSRLPNNGSAEANLQLILELQRQQIQQQAQQQAQQQQSQQQQSRPAQPQQLLQQQQAPPLDHNLLSGIQALLMQPNQQQAINQSNLQQLGLGIGLSQALATNPTDLGQSIQQRDANQLLMRQQNIDELLAAAARSQQPQAQLTNTSQLAALLANSGNPLQGALQMQLGSLAGIPGTAQTALLGATQQITVGEQKDSSEKESANDSQSKGSASQVTAAKTEESTAPPAAAAKKDDGESESEVDEAEAGEDEEDHPANDTFPFKLHRMLEHAENSGMDNLISFSEDGKAFSIHKPREFVSDIMPKYFTTSRMSSFQRQLNLYGFRRVTEGRDKGSYYHKYFIKGRRGLCKKIKRKKASAKPQAYDASGMQAAANTMSIRELLAQRQYQQMYPGLPGGLSAAVGGGAGVPPSIAASGLDASQALLANSQLSQQLEILVRQKQEEDARQQQQQQQQQANQQFPPFGNPGGPSSGASS